MTERKIQVNVTQEHIDSARRYSGSTKTWSQSCPVALALRDALSPFFPPSIRFTAGYTTWTASTSDWPDWNICMGVEKKVGLLPEEARNFIALVDQGRRVQPFSFHIYLDVNLFGESA